jgi:hypothetical protein
VIRTNWRKRKTNLNAELTTAIIVLGPKTISNSTKTKINIKLNLNDLLDLSHFV